MKFRIVRAALLRMLLLAAVLGTGSGVPAQAQIFNKIFGGKDDRRKPVRRTPPPASRNPTPPAKAAAAPKKTAAPKPKPFAYPQSARKERYRIDVLAQLYLDELVKGGKAVYKDRIPEKAVAGMNFYEGIKLAVDTLGYRYDVDVHVHDVASAGQTVEALIARGTLDSSDLIIGALPSAILKPVADFAKRRSVNFVSALSPADAGIEDNPYFTLLQPTLLTHCEELRRVIDQRHRRQPVLMLHREGVSAEANARRYLMGTDSAGIGKLAVDVLPSRTTLASYLDTTATSIILIPVLDAAYAETLLRVLKTSFPTANFEVYGMPTWRGIASLKKPDAFPGLTVSYTAPFYFDASTASGQAVARTYRRTFSGTPGDMVYRGYETLQWFAYLLDRYGTVFNSKIEDAGSAGFTRFSVQPRYDKADGTLLYNENRNLYLYRYSGGNLTVE